MDSEELEYKNEKHFTRISIIGDGNKVILAQPEAVELLREETVLSSIKKVIKPVTKEGYDSLEFESKSDVEKISKSEAFEIISLQRAKIQLSNEEPQLITAWVTVYSPVYDKEAKNWRFEFGNSVEYMDISETNIAEKAFARGGALIDDAYYIRLEILQEHKAGGKITNYFKIKEVLDFRPARIQKQENIFDDRV